MSHNVTQCYTMSHNVTQDVTMCHIMAQNVTEIEIKLFFNLQGSVWYSLLKWTVVSNMTRSLGYTASSLGNHEFDDGVGDLTKFATEVIGSYPLLACNLVKYKTKS